MSNQADNFDILDASVEDLLIFEGFKPINAGTHRLRIKNEIFKDKQQRDAVRTTLELLEIIELADTTETPVELGHKTTISYSLYTKEGKPNQIGQGQLRDLLEVLKPVFGGANNRELIENSNGAEIIATLKVRTNKQDPDQKSNEIKKGSIRIE